MRGRRISVALGLITFVSCGKPSTQPPEVPITQEPAGSLVNLPGVYTPIQPVNHKLTPGNSPDQPPSFQYGSSRTLGPAKVGKPDHYHRVDGGVGT